MIVAEPKPIEEIGQLISPYDRVLILGCGTCVTVCGAGGEREVSFLHHALRLAQASSGNHAHRFSEHTVKRQCDFEFLDVLGDRVKEADAILSLGCGIGVQVVAEYFPDTMVLPGVNTSFLGMSREWSVWDERCAACGDCRLGETAGICPIARCTKGILNGPCGGTNHGKCEVDQAKDCAWTLIYRRLEALGQLEKMHRYYPPRNFQVVPRPGRMVRKAEIEVGESDGKVTV